MYSAGPAIGEEIDGYRVLEVLGRGGMGIVYEAEDLALGRTVALKMIDPALAHDEVFLSRFRREGHALARINSPHIVTVHALRSTERGLFIVMEYVDGGNLAERLARGALPLQRAVALSKGVLCALADAHRVGVVHRDIKPSNVMLTQAGQVKLTDFGLAKVHHPDSASTVTQGVSGTLHYMSPEQVKALGPVDHRTDLYSAGLVLYEMLAGRRPFDPGSGQFTIMKQIVEGTLPPVQAFNEGVPGALAQVVKKALEKDPAQRYQNAEEMLEALERFERAHEEESAPPPSLTTLAVTRPPRSARSGHAPDPTSSDPPKRRKRSALLVAGAVLLLALGLIAFAASSPGRFEELLASIRSIRTSAGGETTATSNEQPPPPSKVRLAVRVDPPGAEVWVDGKNKGLAPLDAFEVAPGSLEVRAQKAGYALFDTMLVLAPEEAEDLAIALERVVFPPALGHLRVRSEPDSATVLLNGKRIGETPYEAPVGVGTYQVVVQREGYEPDSAEVDVREGETAALERALVRREGLLRVLVMPYGAIYVDEVQKRGAQGGWYEERLPYGTYDLRAVHPKLGSWKKRVAIDSESPDTVLFNFGREFKVRVVASTPDGEAVRNAEIYIDGELHNMPTPREITLQAGTHNIEVRKSGYELIGGAQEITLEADAEQPLEFTLKEAD